MLKYIHPTIKPLFVLLFGVLLSVTTFGKKVVSSKTLSVSSFTENAVAQVQDDEYLTLLSSGIVNFEDVKVVNSVILAIDTKDKRYQGQAYQAKVIVEITRQVWNGSSFVEVKEDVELGVNYTLSGMYQDKAIYEKEGGHLLSAKIKSISPSQASKVMNLTLTSQIEIERYYNLDLVKSPKISHSTANLSTRGELLVEFDQVIGAEEYELEWTYVNDVAANGEADQLASQIEITEGIFRNNSTRVSLFAIPDVSAMITYPIPMVYEKGFILYRVRAIGAAKQDRTKIVTGNWSSSTFNYDKVSDFKRSDNIPNWYRTEGHEQLINWQSTISFIEGGKNKVAINYADGTLRSRQQVSRLNTDDEIIVGESVYDHQGRKAVDILPVPAGSQKIEYKKDFNVNKSDESYTRENFDKDQVGNDCKVAPDELKTSSGASKYYSSQNDKKDNHDQYLPDAEGYPIVQTVYTNDNTGRVSAQGGVGKEHQIGNGRETKYFYGKPLQVELDRMLGSEAGDASHYQKNMVIDPNGQVSISYLDMEGKVVATSLAGNGPSQLKKLESNSSSSIEADLLQPKFKKDDKGNLIEIPVQRLEKTGNTAYDDKKIYTQELLLSEDGDRTFNYEALPTTFDLKCNDNGIIKEYHFDCVVDVEILLEDKCGANFFVRNGDAIPSGVAGKNILMQLESGGTLDITQSSGPDAYVLNDVKVSGLKQGAYTVSKVLTVNDKVMNHYLDQYLKEECVLGLPDFLADNLALIDTLGCETDCDQCLTELGSYDQYDIRVTPDCDLCLSFDEYKEKYDECQEMCNNDPVTCENILEAMLIDMSPMGQYGLISRDPVTNKFDLHVGDRYSKDPVSVYNINNVLPANKIPANSYYNNGNIRIIGTNNSATAYWKKPKFWKDNGDRNHYYDSDGKIAQVKVYYEASTNTFDPDIESNLKSNIALSQDGYVYVEPQDLRYLTDFILAADNDNKSWFYSLILYHPEYRGYEYCLIDEESHAFDEIMVSSETVEDFVKSYAAYKNISESEVLTKLNDPLGASPSTALDPYFQTLPGDAHYKRGEHYVARKGFEVYKTIENKMFSLPQAAYVVSNCPMISVDASGPCQQECGSDFDGQITDTEWNLYRGMYTSFKQSYQEYKRTQSSIYDGYYNGCIGDTLWHPSKDGFSDAFYRFSYHPSPWNFVGHVYFRKVSQYHNPTQPCFYGRAKHFHRKQARYPRIQQLVQSPSLDGIKCFQSPEVDSDDPDFTIDAGSFPETNCPAADLAVIDELGQEANLGYLSECGECPIVKQLSTLVNKLATQQGGITADALLGCYPDGLAEWTPALVEASGVTEGTIQTKFEPVVSGNKLVGTISNDIGSFGITLSFLNGYDYKDIVTGQVIKDQTFTWSDIKGFCCAKFIDNPTVLPLVSGRNFLIGATVEVAQGSGVDATTRLIKIQLEGSVSSSFVALNECDMTKCVTNEVGVGLAQFLNVLVKEESPEQGVQFVDEQTGEDVTGDFGGYTERLTKTEVTTYSESGDNEYAHFFYELTDAFKNEMVMLASNEEVKRVDWQRTSLTATSLIGTVSFYKTTSGSQVASTSITLTADQMLVFSNIRRFTKIRPTGDGHTFTILAEVVNEATGLMEFVELKGSSNGLDVGTCTEFGYGNKKGTILGAIGQ